MEVSEGPATLGTLSIHVGTAISWQGAGSQMRPERLGGETVGISAGIIIGSCIGSCIGIARDRARWLHFTPRSMAQQEQSLLISNVSWLLLLLLIVVSNSIAAIACTIAIQDRSHMDHTG